MAIQDTETAARGRTERVLFYALTAAAILFWLRVVAYAFLQNVPRSKFAIAFLAGSIFVYILDELRSEPTPLDWVLLGVCGLVTTMTAVHLHMNFETLLRTRTGYALEDPVVFGVLGEYQIALLFTLVVVYLTYRAFGAAFLGVVLLTFVYYLYGNHFPGIFGHGGFEWRQLVNTLVLEFDGFFGSITQIVAAWVALFLLYAGLLRAFGAFDLIIRVAFRAAQLIRSGVAQSAVIASLIIGSINGAQTANAAMTGSFTIPLMKRSGLRSDTAGGIEAVASSGGQIMPPVMGAAAFVMASILGIGYFDVLVAGIVPAAIFFVSVAVGVHYVSIKQLEDVELDADQFDVDFDETIDPRLEGIRHGVPFAVLLYTLGIAQFTVGTAALYTCIAMVITGVGIPLARSVADESISILATAKAGVFDVVDGLRFGAVALAPIAIVIAAVNGIVDVLNATGIPGVLSLAILDISGGVVLFGVILAMIICIVLGLGMPTVAAYTIVALLIAPTLTGDFAVPDLAAHYFVFYSAILSGITPPIAISVVVTTGIAGSNFWRTCLEALRLAVALFILPFAFIYNPEIVTGGPTLETLQSGAIALLGAVSVIHGLNYHEHAFGGGRSVNWPVRAVYFVLGVVAMAHPGTMVRLGAVALAVGLFVLQRRNPVKRVAEEVPA